MFYAYSLIDESGIVSTWKECESKVKGKKARFKKFNSRSEAQDWLNSGANYEVTPTKKLDENGIYFDAGTGRGIGTEVRVTDYKKNSLLDKILPASMINEFGNYLLDKDKTNNFGELIGANIALRYALKFFINTIYGDSELVIKYWINLRYNKENLSEDTIRLIHETNKLYLEFKDKGGKLIKISGDINPADLGFHK